MLGASTVCEFERLVMACVYDTLWRPHLHVTILLPPAIALFWTAGLSHVVATRTDLVPPDWFLWCSNMLYIHAVTQPMLFHHATYHLLCII